MAVHLDAHVHAHAGHGTDLPWFNFGTIAAFLAWFGGTGYFCDRYYSVWVVLALGRGHVERTRRPRPLCSGFWARC